MGEHFFLFENLDLLLFDDDLGTVLLFIREIGEFELVADESAFEFFGEGLIFIRFAPKTFF